MAVDAKSVLDQIKIQTVASLRDLGHEIDTNAREFTDFLTTLEPEVEEALESGDDQSLSFIRDRIAIHAGSSALDAIQQSQIAVTATVMTVIRVALAVVSGALA